MTSVALQPKTPWRPKALAGGSAGGGASTDPRRKSRRRLSLEARLGAVTVLVLVLASTTLFIELSARDRAKLMSAKASAAAMVTQLLANELSPDIDFGDVDDVSATLNYLRGNPEIVSAAVWAAPVGDEPLAAWVRPGAPVSSRPAPDDADGAQTSPDWLVATRTILGRHRTQLGRVRVVFTLAPENDAFRASRWQLLGMTAGLSALAAIVLGLLARRYVVGPLKRLAYAAGALADGDLSARVEIRRNDEISDLARAFNVMSDAVRFREERLHKELELAKRIQTSILPRSLEVPGLELSAVMLPTTQVGGDYYDVLPVEGGCWIGIGDVAGHGLDAGLFMLMTQSIVASLVAQNPSASPRDVVCVLNEVLVDNIRNRLQRDDHATLTVIHYDESGELVLAGAHEDIIVCRSRTGRCEAVATPGTWVGGRRDIRAGTVESRFLLEPRDVMLLYTDGVVELRNAQGEPFGFERLCAELERVHHEDVSKIQEHLLSAVGEWGTAEDDVTMVVARYVGPK
jgi:serine phosphatase RsbU (regulator of sigma subunit)